MASYSHQLRDGLVSVFNTAKSGWILQPTVKATDLPDNTEGEIPLTLYVVALDFDEEKLTRKGSRKITQQIAIGLVKTGVTPDDGTTANLVLLCQQIRSTIVASAINISLTGGIEATWEATEAVKDETGLPFGFVKSRETASFESFFNATYTFLI